MTQIWRIARMEQKRRCKSELLVLTECSVSSSRLSRMSPGRIENFDARFDIGQMCCKHLSHLVRGKRQNFLLDVAELLLKLLI
jgi:hypothetical protein